MPTSEQSALNVETYTALGRFVVAFSGLLHALETSTAQLIIPASGGRGNTLLSAVLADRAATPIVSSFFSVLYKRWEGELVEGDIKILKCLRRELDDLVKERNRLMHDAWMTSVVGGSVGPHALSRLRVRSHGSGIEFESEEYPPEKLEALANDAFRLASVVNGAVWYHHSGQNGPELHTRMRVVGRKVQREP